MSESRTQPGPPSPAELLAGYLRRQQNASAAGLAAPDLAGEVLPYEAGPVQPVDAGAAWEEAIAALAFVGVGSKRSQLQPRPGWPALVSGHEPAGPLAFSMGNFPQLVRDLQVLLNSPRLRELRPAQNRPMLVPGLAEWATQASGRRTFPQMVLVLGALRLARLYEQADGILKAHEEAVPLQWRTAWENEKAALAWHRGDEAQARAAWLDQPDSPAVHFNRGMSALFLDRPDEARQPLKQAVAQLPETSAWHHLGHLYLALAELRAR